MRSGNALIQTIGRAARHIEGKAVLYADKMTDSMSQAIEETNRRRTMQEEYNRQHGIEPRGIIKSIRDLTDRVKIIAETRPEYHEDGKNGSQLCRTPPCCRRISWMNSCAR